MYKVAWIPLNVSTFFSELPKNETKVILLEEINVPKVPKKNANNNYNGRDRQFQKSQDSKAGDTKGFHRNGDDSPYEKRYGSSGTKIKLYTKKKVKNTYQLILQECLCVRIFASLVWFCSPLSTCCNYLSLLCKCNQLFARSSCAQKIIMFFEDERRKKMAVFN